MSGPEAIAFLSSTDWCPGMSTAGHPQRDDIKAALAAHLAAYGREWAAPDHLPPASKPSKARKKLK